jgi:hypothetical protein
MCLRRSRLVAALCLLCGLASPGARAQDAIGGARVVERDVAGSLGDVHRRVNKGDDVFQDEVITTSVESLAQIDLVDLTNLSIGPSAQVKLDRFVFDRGGKKTMVIAVARGAFRFVSAAGDHKNYMVKTPTATIGVRGTRFDVLATAGRTDVILHQGAIDLCNAAGSACRRMSPGHSATVTTTRMTRPRPATPQTWSFEKTLQAAGLSEAALAATPAAPTLASVPNGNGGSGSGGSQTQPTGTSQQPSSPGTGSDGGGRGLGGNVGGGPRGANGGPSSGDGGGRDVNGGIPH